MYLHASANSHALLPMLEGILRIVSRYVIIIRHEAVNTRYNGFKQR